MAELTIDNLVAALEQFPPHYHAIDVFADDLREVTELRASGRLPESWRPLDREGRRFAASVRGHSYHIELFDREGVVRFAREEVAPSAADSAAGALLGGLAGAAIGAASSRKGETWAPGLVLGLLVGAVVVGTGGTRSGDTPAVRRVFTLRFDPASHQWLSYDGGLVPWMKASLLTSAA